MFSCESYFYNQKKAKRHRRLRIIDDSYSVYGGDRGTVVTFRGKHNSDTESTAGFAPRPNYIRRPSTGIIRPGSSRGRQVVIDPTASILPPVDSSGPRLVAAVEEVFAASEIRHTDEKLEFLKEVEQKVTSSQRKRNDWNISEAKFASSSILSRLSKHLYLVSEDFEVTLSLDLVDELNRQYEHLVENTVVEKRRWQTDCYQDFPSKNKLPFLTSVPDNPKTIDNANTVVGKLVRKQQKEQEKRVQLKQKPRVNKMSSPERPMTARSIMSNYSIKSDISQLSDDGRESRNDYDLLPAELRPTILHYRRESTTPKLKTVRTSTATRLEKMKKLRTVDTMSSKHKKKKAKFQVEKETGENILEEESSDKEDNSPAKPAKPLEFRLSAPLEEDWIVAPGDSEDPEANTLRLWEKQLKELMRSRQEEKIVAKQKGQDGPLVVKFYNDPQMRSLRTKGHQRAATFPMPSFFSKLPPSVASFSTPTPNDALLIGEGLKVFVLTLPDGSGYCNYHSGRVAISMSRHSVATKGIYTLVYEDREGSPLIAYFTPSGGGGCYHHNGGLRMLYDKEGGSLFDEDGHVSRKWSWPTDGLNMPVTVNLQVNANMSISCTSLTSVTLRFSCRGQSHRYSMNTADTLETLAPINLAQGKMQTDMFFYSKFAMDHSEEQLATVDDRREAFKKKSTRKSMNSPPPELEDKPARELIVYKEKIKGVVDGWMDHYRECIGIALPKRLLSSSKRDASSISSRDFGSSLGMDRGRQVKTSMGFYPKESTSRPSSRHTRSYTHPFPSPSNSRSPSPLLQFGLPTLKGSANGRRSTSPQHALSTPYENIRSRTSPEPLKPFKAGISKPKPTLVRNSTGCPVGLRNKVLKNLKSTPRCKCDKRHIPYLFDLEYDSFLLSQVPKSQLIVICVLSSVVENSCPCEPMLDALYCTVNRNRFSPCNQCSMDEYRLLKYDVCQVLRREGVSKAMLTERHNATPGTFLMYMGSKLVFADRIFNGYGTARKDFMKQVHKSIQDGKMGRCLPDDFKLSRHHGNKIQSRNAWAYPVSGVMQDLIPFTPESSSSSMSRHSVTDVTDDKFEDTFTGTSFADMSYGGDLQLSLSNSEFNSRSQSRVSLADSIASVRAN